MAGTTASCFEVHLENSSSLPLLTPLDWTQELCRHGSLLKCTCLVSRSPGLQHCFTQKLFSLCVDSWTGCLRYSAMCQPCSPRCWAWGWGLLPRGNRYWKWTHLYFQFTRSWEWQPRNEAPPTLASRFTVLERAILYCFSSSWASKIKSWDRKSVV